MSVGLEHISNCDDDEHQKFMTVERANQRLQRAKWTSNRFRFGIWVSVCLKVNKIGLIFHLLRNVVILINCKSVSLLWGTGGHQIWIKLSGNGMCQIPVLLFPH